MKNLNLTICSQIRGSDDVRGYQKKKLLIFNKICEKSWINVLYLNIVIYKYEMPILNVRKEDKILCIII